MNSAGIIKKYYELMDDAILFPPVHNMMQCVFAAAGVGTYLFEYYPLKRSDPICLLIAGDGDSIAYLSQSRLSEITEVAFSLFLNDYSRFIYLINEFNGFGQEVVESYVSLKIKTNKDFVVAMPEIKTVIEKTKRLNAIGWFSLHIDQGQLAGLIERNGIAITPERFAELWGIISLPYSESLDRRRHRNILERIVAGGSLEEIASSFQFYFQNYNVYIDEKEACRRIRMEYDLIDCEAAQKELNLIRMEERLLRAERQRVESNLSVDEKRVFEFIQTAIMIRDIRKDYLSAALSLQLILTEQAAIKAEIDRRFMGCILMEEVERGSEYLVSHANEIVQRNEGFIMMIDVNEHASFTLIDNAKELCREVEQHFMGHGIATENIKGTIAFKGKVKGRVRVIRNPITQSLDEGEILVTGMTRPEFVPLMKLAGAIVTDEGGITCHAAIIAREMKKPCIIGTRNATQILKDGDMVEVNADTGVITILE